MVYITTTRESLAIKIIFGWFLALEARVIKGALIAEVIEPGNKETGAQGGKEGRMECASLSKGEP